MSEETFGIEIETGFPENHSEYRDQGGRDGFAKVHEALVQAGLRVQRINSHIGSSANEWVVKRDGSLDGKGLEVVSPPLKFNDPEDRAQVDRVVRALQLAGCKPITEGGIHVHIGARGMDAKQIAAVCRFVWIYEDVLYRIASSGWKTVRWGALHEDAYAAPIDAEIVQRMLKVKAMEDLAKAWTGETWSGDNGNRYQAVNLNSYWIRETIEFRLFNTSLNPERIQAYIALSMAIVRDAKAGHVRYTKKRYPLGWMASHDDAACRRLLIRFQQVMTTESRDTHRLMSKQDWKRLLMCWKDSRPQKKNFNENGDEYDTEYDDDAEVF